MMLNGYHIVDALEVVDMDYCKVVEVDTALSETVMVVVVDNVVDGVVVVVVV